jgi:hypothetical protein
MAPSFGIRSIWAAPSVVAPAVTIAVTSESWSAANTSRRGLPAVSNNSKRSPMRTIMAFGKRE